ncbi:MAG: endolytic transglycosylase MltG [Anaerolineales bacterium]
MRRFIPNIAVAFIVICVVLIVFVIPSKAAQIYGPPSERLSFFQVIQYSAKLVWDDGLLINPIDPNAAQQSFRIQQGESVSSIADRLRQNGLISDAGMFRDYLIYTGLDTSIQAGNYDLSAGMSIVDIAHAMQNATSTQVTFVVFPGWRMEEIAASIPTSGLDITPDAFLAAAQKSRPGFGYLSSAASTEGFLYPDSYILPRITTADELVEVLVRNFDLHLTSDLRDGFNRQGLSIYQAVTLASIVQREAVHDDEAPMIASVYLNRLKIDMRLEADPTVQYGLGYDSVGQTWWTNPLSEDDLKINSPYNTYVIDGLPPTPISNPGLAALRAVAFPADSSYYYFSARCDDSGYHNFAQTFQEQLQNLCP